MEVLRKIVFVFICVFPFVGVSQSSFYKKYTSGPFDQGNGITQLPDSSYAITGTSAGFDNNSGQAFLMITDSLGNHKWTKDYGGFGDDIGVRVIHLPGDGFFIVGYSGSTVNGNFDFVVFKTDESGDLEWEKKYGGPGWEILHDAVLLADGGLILVGETEGLQTQGKDIFMVRTTAVGDTVWTKTIQTPQDDVAYAVDTLSSTQFVVGGDIGDAGVLKGMITGFNIDGTQEWLEFYDQQGVTMVRDLAVYEDHIYIVGGLYNSNQTRYDIWYAKGDMNGVFVKDWTDSYSESAIFNAITIRDNANVFIAMMSQAVDLNPFIGGEDVFVLKLGTNMYFNNYTHGFSAVNDDIINQLLLANDGGIVLVGTVSDDPVELSLGTDIMIARIGPSDEVTYEADTGLDFVSIAQEEISMVSLYPNPTSDIINFPSNIKGMDYQIINFQGKTVMSGKVDSSVSLINLNSGIYILKVENQNNIWTSKVIKN